jgi:hypothetical protein
MLKNRARIVWMNILARGVAWLAATQWGTIHAHTITWNNYQIFDTTATPTYRWGPVLRPGFGGANVAATVPDNDDLSATIELQFALTAAETATALGVVHQATNWLYWQEDDTTGDKTLVSKKYNIGVNVPFTAVVPFTSPFYTVVPSWQLTRETAAASRILPDDPDLVIEVAGSVNGDRETHEIEFAVGAATAGGAAAPKPGNTAGVGFAANDNEGQKFLAQAGAHYRVYTFDGDNIYGFNSTGRELRALFNAAVTFVDGVGTDNDTTTAFTSGLGITALAANQPTIGDVSLVSSDLIPAMANGALYESVTGYSQSSLANLTLPGNGGTTPLSGIRQPGSEALWVFFTGEAEHGFLFVSVPEPSAALMLVTGVVGVALCCRRRAC